MNDQVLVIYRRPTPAGRTSYWIDNPLTGELSRVSQGQALRMVSIGRAQWADTRRRQSNHKA